MMMAAAVGAAVLMVAHARPVDEFGQPVFAVEGQGGCDSSPAFDYLLLVQQWPRDFGQNDDYMTLHGLWPSRDGTSGPASTYPCTCTNEAFSNATIQPILPDMQKYWPSLKGPNAAFWAHEWTKHGTCSTLKQLDFFQTTLDARKKYDAYAAMTGAGFVEGQAYGAEAYDAAFHKAYGAAAMLGCDQNNGLREVGFCLSKVPSPMPLDCADSVLQAGGEADNCDRTKPIVFVKTGAAPSPPHPHPPPGPPGPPATQCAPDQRGPACKTDADCKNVPNCVRCAHSGFCTEEKGEKDTAFFA